MVGNKTKTLAITTYIQHCIEYCSKWRKVKKKQIESIRIIKEEIKTSLFAEDTIRNKNTKNLHKISELKSKFNCVAG